MEEKYPKSDFIGGDLVQPGRTPTHKNDPLSDPLNDPLSDPSYKAMKETNGAID